MAKQKLIYIIVQNVLIQSLSAVIFVTNCWHAVIAANSNAMKGDCDCISVSEIKCSCGHESYLAPCKFIQSGIKPKCNHKCSVLLNCRKHYHRLECCPDEQIGLARERDRKKLSEIILDPILDKM